jgi:hypothetical protein
MWDQFIRVFKSKDLVVLLTAVWKFVILPRAFFQSEHEWNILQDMVANKIQPIIE